ncbi:thermonuclease family protein [Chloroflexota bacterium]
MAEFKVKKVLDGNTFTVTSNWNWQNQQGNRVRLTGYDTPELHEIGGQRAKEKLTQLVLGKMVDLRKAYSVDRGRLVCDVYFQGSKLADYLL